MTGVCRTVKDSSVVAVQVFDQRRRSKRKDQGCLGVVNIKVFDVLDPVLGGVGIPFIVLPLWRRPAEWTFHRNTHIRPQKVER